MRKAFLLCATALAVCALAGCTPLPPGDDASIGTVPPAIYASTYVGVDPTTAGLDTAEEAFVHPQALRGNPAAMALAVASLDALAGQLANGGRFAGQDQIAQDEMLEARDQARAALGVQKGASSQQVIDALLTARAALMKADMPDALAALGQPVFANPPTVTLGILSNFPHIPIAARATIDAQQLIYPQDGGGNGGGGMD